MATPDHVTYLGAYAVCLDGDGRILLARIREDTPDDGRWTLPGGGVQFGEHPDDAVRRELEEETGLVGEPEGVLGMYATAIARSVSFGGRPLHFIGTIYRVRIVGGELRAEADGTTDACAWFDRREVAGLPVVGLVDRALALAFPDADG